jgi:hypothetical protein
VRRGRLICDESQLEVVDDSVDYAIVCEESNDLHRGAALRSDHRVNLIDLPDHLCPALGGEGPKLPLQHPERKRPKACVPGFPPMGIGVEAVISHCDLALVRDMGSRPGDELQVVHPLHLSGVFPEPIADLKKDALLHFSPGTYAFRDLL